MPIFSQKKFLTSSEEAHLRRLLATENNRNSLIIEMLLTYGMRQGELLKCLVSDFDQKDGSLYVTGTKGSMDRQVPLSTKLKARLKREVQGKGPDERIFPIGRITLFVAWSWIKPCDKPLHCLRHTAAVRMYRQTKDIHFVKRLLGHRNIANTLIYVDFDYDQDEMRKVFCA